MLKHIFPRVVFSLLLAFGLLTACGGGKYTKATYETASGTYTYKKPKIPLNQYKTKFFNLYSEGTDIKLGKKVMDQQIKIFKKKKVGVDLPKHRAIKRRIERVVKRIAAVSDKPYYPYEVHIFDKPDIVNAFCLPGGKIGVFSGLFGTKKGIINPKSDKEIAAVVGHEMAHATLRHVTRRISKLQGWGLLGSIASIAMRGAVGTDAQRAFNQVFSFGTNLYLPTYSRGYERDADQVGFYYMSKAGYDPKTTIRIWKKSMEKGGKNKTRTHFLASHPASGARAKTLEAWLPEAEEIYKKARVRR